MIENAANVLGRGKCKMAASQPVGFFFDDLAALLEH